MIYTGNYHKSNEDQQCEDIDLDAEDDRREDEADYRMGEMEDE